MEFNKQLVSFVALLALLVLSMSSVSALATIDQIEVSGIETIGTGNDVGVYAGDTLPVRVFYTADDNVSDVRVKVEFSGGSGYTFVSQPRVVDSGRAYSMLIPVQVPYDIDPREDLSLLVSVQSKTESVNEVVTLSTSRESYTVEILDVAFDNKVNAGSNLAIDLVLKNRGRELAEDTFVRVSIPALGVERRVYFGDLSPVDQNDPLPEKEDAVAGRMLVAIPASAPAGIYAVQIDVFNSDSKSTVTKKVAVTGASVTSRVVSTSTTKTFGVNDAGSYSVTIVNTGDRVQVYDLSFESPSGLTVDSDESVFAVPAGTSKTVKVNAVADKAGKYAFSVNVNSDGQLVKTESYVANVEGKTKSGSASATVVLTVVLAIIFVVLLVVLIVLLTKKPQKAEEFGESYY